SADVALYFGRARPATGCATELTPLVGLGTAELAAPPTGSWAPHDADPTLWQAICELGRQGERVVQALDGQARESALSAGCDRQLVLKEDTWMVAPLAS